jgi:tRNA 2-thiouridine synthesizing protein E
MAVNVAPVTRRYHRIDPGHPDTGEEKGAMAIDFNGRMIASTATGYLENRDDWSEDLARHMAKLENVELTDRHWDVLKYLREEFFGNNEHQPNTRTIVKAMSERWGQPVDQRELYELFPGDPSKQAGRIAGLPESRRKGGY